MPRRVGRDGRSMNKSFSYPKSFDSIIEKIEEIASKEGTFFSDIVVDQLKIYYNEHGKSENNQTTIPLFEKDVITAIPNMYRPEKIWQKFYDSIKSSKDYAELDKQINMINKIHNQKLRSIKK